MYIGSQKAASGKVFNCLEMKRRQIETFKWIFLPFCAATTQPQLSCCGLYAKAECVKTEVFLFSFFHPRLMSPARNFFFFFFQFSLEFWPFFLHNLERSAAEVPSSSSSGRQDGCIFSSRRLIPPPPPLAPPPLCIILHTLKQMRVQTHPHILLQENTPAGILRPNYLSPFATCDLSHRRRAGSNS